MIFSQRVVSITQDKIVPKVVDNILSYDFITYRLVGTGEKWSGETLKFPIKIAKNSLGGSFSGLDVHSVNTADTRITLSYDPRGYEIPCAIPGIERAVNETDAQVLKLVATQMEETQLDAADQVGGILYADGTGNGSKDFNGLDNLDDDGTTASTVGNQSRTTYTSLQGTRTSSSGTVSLLKMATLISAIAGGSVTQQRPTVGVTTEAIFDLIESLFSATVRANYEANGFPMVTRNSKAPVSAATLKGAMGFVSLVYKQVPIVADEKAPSGTLWMLNENYLNWYGLKSNRLKAITLANDNVEGVYDDAPSANTGFQWTDFMESYNQFGEVAHFYLLGNLVTNQPRRQGRLTAITGV